MDTSSRPTLVEERPPTPAARPGPARRPGDRGAGRQRGGWIAAGRLVVLLALAALTAWNLTRSDALDEGRDALRRGDHRTAVRRALDHLGRRPWSDEAARIAARGLSGLGFARQAEPYYRRGAPLGREDLLDRAFGLLRADLRQAAARVYEVVLQRWPDDPTALRQLAVVRVLQSRPLEAIDLARRLARVPGHAVFGWTMVAAYQHNRQEHHEVLAALDEVLRLDPDLAEMPLPRAEFWRYYGENALAIGRGAAARRELTRVLYSGTDAPVQADPTLWHLLGQAQQFEGDLATAEETLRYATRLGPTDAVAWAALGVVLLSQDRPQEAIAALARALELTPDSWTALYNLILANRRLGRTEEVARLQVLADELLGTEGVPTTGMHAPPSTTPTPAGAGAAPGGTDGAARGPAEASP